MVKLGQVKNKQKTFGLNPKFSEVNYGGCYLYFFMSHTDQGVAQNK